MLGVTIVGVRRLIDDNNVVHAYHNGALWADRTNATACGIHFTAYEMSDEGVESSRGHRFRVTDQSRGQGPIVLCGTFETLEVSCMSCLVRMRTWDRM